MLGKYFGVDLKYTAVVNFKGFEDVVDALGGIEVNVDMDMKYVDNYDGTNINLKKVCKLLMVIRRLTLFVTGNRMTAKYVQ